MEIPMMRGHSVRTDDPKALSATEHSSPLVHKTLLTGDGFSFFSVRTQLIYAGPSFFFFFTS